MLVIRPLPTGGHRYLTAGLDPAGRWGEAPGSWLGRGAAALDLNGHVAPPVLGRIVDGQAPDGSQPLCAARVNRRCGLELVFAAPKSVSVTALLAAPELKSQLVEAHEAAVADAVGYLERHACVVRRRGRRMDGDGVVAAAFAHRVSRSLDPHVHSHVLIANLSRDAEGCWRALLTPLIFRESASAGAVYAASLRWRTTELGFEWRGVDGGRHELSGVPRPVIDAFSRRRAQVIARHTRDEGAAVSLPGAVVLTRPARPPLIDFEALAALWMTRARQLSFEPPMPSLTVRPPAPVLAPESVLGGLTASADVFRRRDVVREYANRLAEGAAPSAIAVRVDAALSSPIVVSVDGARFTTRAVGRRRDALRRVIGDRDDVAVVDLPRGTGRTDAIERIRRRAEAAGTDVHLVAPSLASARSMEALTAIVAGTCGELGQDSAELVVVDAERLSTTELGRLVDRPGPITLVGASGRSATFDRLVETASSSDVTAPEARGGTTHITVETRAGPVVVHETIDEARHAALAAWEASRVDGRLAILVAPEGEMDHLGLTPGTVVLPAEARRLGQHERIVLGAGPVAPATRTTRHVVGTNGFAFVASPHWLVRTLGKPPADLGTRARWYDAARSLGRYRAEWRVELDAFSHRQRLEQRLDRRRTLEQVTEARRELGLAPLAVERARGLSR